MIQKHAETIFKRSSSNYYLDLTVGVGEKGSQSLNEQT